MVRAPLKEKFKKLAFNKKIILGGAFLASISAFLPWYSDIDKFNSGTTFYGISGPLYLAGLIILFSGLAVFGIILLQILEKPAPKLPLKENHFFIFTSILSFLMLVISSSVYFHPKFGINLTEKSMGIGMILGFIGNAGVLMGALLSLKKENPDFEAEAELKPLIDVEDRIQPFSNIPKTIDRETYARDMAQESLHRISQEKRNTNDIF